MNARPVTYEERRKIELNHVLKWDGTLIQANRYLDSTGQHGIESLRQAHATAVNVDLRAIKGEKDRLTISNQAVPSYVHEYESKLELAAERLYDMNKMPERMAPKPPPPVRETLYEKHKAFFQATGQKTRDIDAQQIEQDQASMETPGQFSAIAAEGAEEQAKTKKQMVITERVGM
jgi:hypothetical protein